MDPSKYAEMRGPQVRTAETAVMNIGGEAAIVLAINDMSREITAAIDKLRVALDGSDMPRLTPSGWAK